MGPDTLKEPHHTPSSRMSFVEGWKHGKVRLYISLSFISFAILFMFTVLLYGTSLKQVTIVVDGKPMVVETSQPTLQRLLDEQNITVGQYDQLSAKPETVLRHGEQIGITRSKAIYVTIRGKKQTVHTTARTIDQALVKAGIKVDRDDKTFPAGHKQITSGMNVKVLRITKLLVEKTYEDEFDVIENKDSSLRFGTRKTVSKGQNGEIVKKIQKTFADGKLVESKVVDRKIVQVKKNQVVAVGTHRPVQVSSSREASVPPAPKNLKDVDFDYQKVLTNVTLTAYTADYASTGKSKNHKYFGITASGSRVKEGQTIAVDTSVIPMGYWVYIEGVGYRRAEDRGGAVRGNKIDVYVGSHREAMQFGRKRGRTVYVIGPNLPQ